MIVSIKEFNNYIILGVHANSTPKLKQMGIGTALLGFNSKDIFISKEAKLLLMKKINNKATTNLALEIINETSVWWSTPNERGIIIKETDPMYINVIPQHTECSNEIDEQIKKILN